jgi:hypothetical protein
MSVSLYSQSPVHGKCLYCYMRLVNQDANMSLETSGENDRYNVGSPHCLQTPVLPSTHSTGQRRRKSLGTKFRIKGGRNGLNTSRPISSRTLVTSAVCVGALLSILVHVPLTDKNNSRQSLRQHLAGNRHGRPRNCARRQQP